MASKLVLSLTKEYRDGQWDRKADFNKLGPSFGYINSSCTGRMKAAEVLNFCSSAIAAYVLAQMEEADYAGDVLCEMDLTCNSCVLLLVLLLLVLLLVVVVVVVKLSLVCRTLTTCLS